MRILAGDVFEALNAVINGSNISCIQRHSNAVVLTFRRAQYKEEFCKNVLRLRGMPFAQQDVDQPLKYLIICDAPHELPQERTERRNTNAVGRNLNYVLSFSIHRDFSFSSLSPSKQN